MKRSRIASLSVLAMTAFAACSSSSDDLPLGGGGTTPGSSGSGATPSAGAPGNSAGTASSQGGSGNSSAGMTSGAGAPAAGASTNGGGGAGPSGGNAAGGSAGSGTGGMSGGTGGGGGGSNHTVKASAGCMKGSTQVTIPNSVVSAPPGYDGKTPVPVVIVFHAAGDNNGQKMLNSFKSSDLAKKYLMIFPTSTSNSKGGTAGWSLQADKSLFLEVQAAVSSQACVDENRVYATGHSSGAQFVVALLCSGDADFDAVAPVASSVYCQKWQKGPIPALAIHGVQDEERTKYGLNDGDGKKDLQPYLTSNMCTMNSTPFTPDVSACKITTGVDGKPFNPGCVEFSGCSVKTRWCNHNDPQYGTTNHGIPCFGQRAIYDFFESL